jgi:hypothetical protein
MAVLAVLEHHFDDHKFCGDWYQSAKGTYMEVSENGLRFRCKVRNNALHLVLQKNHHEMEDENKQKQLFQVYDANNGEGFNTFLTKVLPRDRTYCQTILSSLDANLNTTSFLHAYLSVGILETLFSSSVKIYKNLFDSLIVSLGRLS